MIDKLPPQNIEAEEAILGGIMLDPEAIDRVSDRLVPEAFNLSNRIQESGVRIQNEFCMTGG